MLFGTLLAVAIFSLPALAQGPQFDLPSLGPLLLGCTLMAASAFGTEFQHRTLPLLLTQPVDRRMLWRDKMVVVALALLVSFAVALRLQHPWTAGWQSEPTGQLGLLIMILLCAFCGAPYLTLLTRSSIAGVVFTIALPNFIGLMVALLVSRFPMDREVESVLGLRSGFVPVAAALTIYCALCLWRGYVRFQNLQVVDGPAREVTLAIELPGRMDRLWQRITARFSGPFGMLVRKELGIQQMSYLAAGAFCGLAVAAALFRWLRPDWGDGLLVVEFALYGWAMPFLVGALAVAEERGWGIAEWHQTLPPSALMQWAAKMLVMLSTSLFLGLMIPGALYTGISALFGKPDFQFPLVPHSFAAALLVYALLTSVAAYAGSLVKGTVPAILLGIILSLAILASLRLVPIFGGTLWLAAGDIANGTRMLNTGLKRFPPVLAQALTLLTMAAVFQRYALANFHRTGVSRSRIGLQVLWLLFVSWLLVCFLTLAWVLS